MTVRKYISYQSLKQIRSEHFDYSWKIENVDQLEALLFNPEATKEELILKSPTFQCGLMADRLAQW
jgi:hypothetical protein